MREIAANPNFGGSAIDTRFRDDLKGRGMEGTDLRKKLMGGERAGKRAETKFVKDVGTDVFMIINDVGVIRRNKEMRQRCDMTNREAMRKFGDKFRILI